MGQQGIQRPVATYRLQLQAAFGLDDAAALLDYLAALGISHVYTSPVTQASPGSTHGYDVTDHEAVNRELGGEQALRRFHARLRGLGLLHMLDIVPNHMGAEVKNHWWRDVLENGLSSQYSKFFDVNWESGSDGLSHKILMPVLGEHYGKLLREGRLKLERHGGVFSIRYEEHALPVAPESLHPVLARAAKATGNDELSLIAEVLAVLPAPRTGTSTEKARRHALKESVMKRLSRLCRAKSDIPAALDAAVERLNADPLKLDALFERQHYRLAYWRSADSDLNYRRFFNVNKLVGLCAEREDVYRFTHRRAIEWVRSGDVSALRVDHVDGLRDPKGYLDRLRADLPETWILVEKILQADERLPSGWAADGTTGYEFIRLVDGLFIDPRGEAPLTEFYKEFTGRPADFADVAAEGKSVVLDGFGGEVNRLTRLLVDIAHRRPVYRDYTSMEAQRAISALLVAWPVYRTYVVPKSGAVGPHDKAYVKRAVRDAALRGSDLDTALLDLVADVMLLRERGEIEDEFIARFQQLTGAVTAKGVEDTAFYRYSRLVSLNEVGGAPGRFGVSVEEFHRAMLEASEHAPLSLLAGATHDTKRGEDVRARISLISEMPRRWIDAVRQWHEETRDFRGDGKLDAEMEYFLYQNLFGAWPIELERFAEFASKAAHEAKLQTNWSAPNEAYEAALKSFIEKTFGSKQFMDSLKDLALPFVLPGRINSMSQALLRLTAPGIPDIYQGEELWENSLVDPDNRRPVDYAPRRRLLQELPTLDAAAIMSRIDEGAPKMWIIRQALALRRRSPECFGNEGTYQPLAAKGRKARHVISFVRGGKAAVIAPRLVHGLNGQWQDTSVELPFGSWVNLLTGESGESPDVSLKSLLQVFPMALIESKET